MNFYQGLYTSFFLFMIISIILSSISKRYNGQNIEKTLNIIGNIFFILGIISFALIFYFRYKYGICPAKLF